MTNDIWNRLVKKLHTSTDKEEKVNSFMTLLDIEDYIGQDEVDKLILKRRQQDEDNSHY